VAQLDPRLVVAVALGGSIGASLRYAINEAWPAAAAGSFPWHTFVVNVSGAFVLAMLPGFAVVRRHHVLPPLLGTGVLGGFTTLSTYSLETRDLLAAGHWLTGSAYVLGTLVTALAAVALADRFSSTAERGEFEDEEGDL
jgi:CrcB protein